MRGLTLRPINFALLVLVTLVLGGCVSRSASPTPSSSSTASPEQPYAGLQNRQIRTLSPERVDDLLAGRGAGYALAAELNHYPGPVHVLQFASELSLTSEQDQAVRETHTSMQQEAQRLGKQLVDLEAELDRAFRSGTITESDLARLTGEIAAVEGKLRNTHLAAHLKTKAILTSEQVARYDQLRGYASVDDAAPGKGDLHGAGQHGEMHHGR